MKSKSKNLNFISLYKLKLAIRVSEGKKVNAYKFLKISKNDFDFWLKYYKINFEKEKIKISYNKKAAEIKRLTIQLRNVINNNFVIIKKDTKIFYVITFDDEDFSTLKNLYKVNIKTLTIYKQKLTANGYNIYNEKISLKYILTRVYFRENICSDTRYIDTLETNDLQYVLNKNVPELWS